MFIPTDACWHGRCPVTGAITNADVHVLVVVKPRRNAVTSGFTRRIDVNPNASIGCVDPKSTPVRQSRALYFCNIALPSLTSQVI